MGVEGTFEYFSEILSKFNKPKKLKHLNTVSLKVRMDCEGCARHVNTVISSMKGVKSVDIDLKQQKVTVNVYVEGSKVLKKVQEDTKKKAELWPYVPYNMVAHPYIAPAYDKRHFLISSEP